MILFDKIVSKFCLHDKNRFYLAKSFYFFDFVMRSYGVAKSASSISLPSSMMIFKDSMPNVPAQDLDTRIRNLEMRINICDDNFLLSSQKFSGYDKQFKNQLMVANQLLQEIEVNKIKFQQNFEGIHDQPNREIKDKVSLYFHVNENKIISSLLNKKKQLKQTNRNFQINDENINKLYKGLIAYSQKKNRESIVPLLQQLVQLQNAQIALIKST